MDQPDDLSIIDAALYWAAQGVPVFPCKDDKRPLTDNGFQDAVTDPKEVRALFEFYGDSARMVGGRMGSQAKMWAIDADTYKGEAVIEWIASLEKRGLLPETRMHRTKNGGLHLFYNGDEYPNLYPTDGVEVRGEGSYVILPGGSAGYRVENDQLTQAPKKLIALLKSMKRDQAGQSIDEVKKLILEAENFHDSLARLAARLSASGLDYQEVMDEVSATLASSLAKNPQHPRHGRWKYLVENTSNELGRIVSTAHNKYNTDASTGAFREAIADHMDRLLGLADAIGFAALPSHREAVKEVVPAEAFNGTDPFDGDGYFAFDDRNIFDQRFIMHPLLCENESILIAAEPKTGKTAVALTLGLHVAAGVNLGPSLRISEPRSVLYFALEGHRAIELRVRAWRNEHYRGREDEIPKEGIPFRVLERRQNLLSEDAREQLAQRIVAYDLFLKETGRPPLGAIFLDTLTKSMPGGDQNSVEDTSSVFDVVSRFRDAGCKASVCFIHHKSRAGNIRGSTNIEADPDVLCSVSKEGNLISLRLDKARSVEDGGSYGFRVQSCKLGPTDQGYELEAPYLTAIDLGEEAVQASADQYAAEKSRVFFGALNGRCGGKYGFYPISTIHTWAASLTIGTKPRSALLPVNSKKVPYGALSKEAEAFYKEIFGESGSIRFKELTFTLVLADDNSLNGVNIAKT